MSPEIIALVTIAASILTAWLTTRVAAHKVKEDARQAAQQLKEESRTAAHKLYAELCDDQQARIKELVGQIRANEQRVTALEQQARCDRERIGVLEADNDKLRAALTAAQAQLVAYKAENDNLKDMIRSLQKQKPMPSARAAR